MDKKKTKEPGKINARLGTFITKIIYSDIIVPLTKGLNFCIFISMF